MWELFNKIVGYNITPNECLYLFSINERITSAFVSGETELPSLIAKGYLKMDPNIVITAEGKKIITSLNTYFNKAKKKTNIQLMGKNWLQKVEEYRTIFPPQKLPSGKLARNNVKTLNESFRWFFNTFDVTWDDVIKATKRYVKEYRANDYLYMKTSQYFIAKQDKHKVKSSELADYCDMVKEGIEEEDDHFKDKVV